MCRHCRQRDRQTDEREIKKTKILALAQSVIPGTPFYRLLTNSYYCVGLTATTTGKRNKKQRLAMLQAHSKCGSDDNVGPKIKQFQAGIYI